MTVEDHERTVYRSGQDGGSLSTALRRWPAAGIAAAVALALAAVLASAPAARAADGHPCPSHQYWDDIVVRGISCEQANRLHEEKLRACVQTRRHVTAHWYVYTCGFGPWRVTERVARTSPLDMVYIRRDKGRIWLRYDALP